MAILDLQVSASTDDCARFKVGDFWHVGSTRWFCGYYDGTINDAGGGGRFLNVAIPKDATITTAYLTLTGDDDVAVVVNTRIQAEDADNAATYSTQANFDGRALTAAVDWDAIPAWTLNTEYDSPEIKTIVQTVVNRAGWVSGNAMAFVWHDWDGRSTQTNGTYRQCFSWDGDNAKAPKLHIEYTLPHSFGVIIG